ncbi:MAG: DNRLRE domain-containing protein [Nanoarchaeota archaeon]|nr:DNRLRE domain-containing protein [Nanoarchaeota archaeon]
MVEIKRNKKVWESGLVNLQVITYYFIKFFDFIICNLESKLESLLIGAREFWDETKYVFKNKFVSLSLFMALSGFCVLGCGKKDGGPTGPSGGNGWSSNQPPTTQIISGPSGVLNDDEASFTWSGNDIDGYVVGYNYKLPPKYPNYNFTAATNKTFFSLEDGQSYTFYVQAKDNDGAYSSPATRSFTVDLETPSGSSGTTNSNGTVNLNVTSQEFTVHVTNNNGSHLSNIDVEGQYNGNGIYEFLAKDFSENYFCDVEYHESYGNKKGDGDKIINSPISINMVLSSINPVSGDFKIEEKEVPFSTPHQNLTPVGCVPLSDLHEFYEEHDALFQNKSYLEFIANNSNIPWFTIALKAEEFRETFIQNVSNVSEVIDYIANLFGQNYDDDAYYLDVYSNNLGVLTHFESDSGYCTVKGQIKDSVTGFSIGSGNIIDILSGPSLNPDIEMSVFGFTLKKVLEGSYSISFSNPSNNFNTVINSYYFNAPNPPFYSSTNVGIVYLTPEISGQDTTIIIQPGFSNGKDSKVEIGYISGSYYYGDINYGSESLDVYSYHSGSNYGMTRSYIQFPLSSIPNGVDIESATLSTYGYRSWQYPSSTLPIKVCRVTSSWNENTITWNNQPSFNTFSYDVTNIYSTTPTWNEWDVTDLVEDWGGSYSNYGLVLLIQAENAITTDTYNFKSSEDNSNNKPKLSVTYTY